MPGTGFFEKFLFGGGITCISQAAAGQYCMSPAHAAMRKEFLDGDMAAQPRILSSIGNTEAALRQ